MNYDVEPSAIKTTASINLLAGIWLFVSAWVYQPYLMNNAWNDWVVGALIALFAIIRLSSPATTRGVSYLNLLLGAWMFASPWVFGYAAVQKGRFINSLCVGAVVFLLGLYGSSTDMGHTSTPPAVHT